MTTLGSRRVHKHKVAAPDVVTGTCSRRSSTPLVQACANCLAQSVNPALRTTLARSSFTEHHTENMANSEEFANYSPSTWRQLELLLPGDKLDPGHQHN